MREHTEKLGTDPILPLLLKLALPSMAGLIIGNLYVVVDRMFVGKIIGATGLAAMNAAMPITMIIFAISILIGRGTAVLYSIELGRKNYAEAQRLFGMSMFLYLTAAAVITIGGLLFLDPLLFLFGIPPEALHLGREYLSISLLGTVFVMLGFQNNLIRGEGYSGLAMFTQVIGAVLNVGLDALFMMGFGWGMAGAAWATVIAQGISTLWVLWFFRSRRSISKLDWRTFRFYGPDYLWRILYNGCSPFAINIAGSLIWTIQNHMLLRYGSLLAMSAFGVILTLNQLLLGLIFGVCMGMQPLIGYNFGAKKFSRVLSAFRSTVFLTALFAVVPYLCIQIFARPLFLLFVDPSDTELVQIGVYSMRCYLLLFPIASGSILVSQYFQSIGRAPVSLFIAMTRQIVFQIPLVLILPQFFGYSGVLFSGPVGDTLAFFVAFFLMKRELQRLRGAAREERALSPETCNAA
ncbi:MAG: Multidrug export protein MepA [Lentisphaerae bacterium ADurb.Bin242]|nr:MAG: Multidrug export protein MepA [Lentisphaerae bacterium ADurb.Bin242]